MKYPHNLNYFTSQLKLDIAEMKSLLETAARSKVRDILSVEVREREREILNLNFSSTRCGDWRPSWWR